MSVMPSLLWGWKLGTILTRCHNPRRHGSIDRPVAVFAHDDRLGPYVREELVRANGALKFMPKRNEKQSIASGL